MEINNINLEEPKSKRLKLLQYIFKTGLRVFARESLIVIATKLELNYAALSLTLHKLCQEGWLLKVKNGIYQVVNITSPIHEFEIAMALVRPAMISYRSAFAHHGLTDQVASTVFVTTINRVFTPQYGVNKKAAVIIRGVEYQFIRLNQELYFGAELGWKGESKYQVTDLERTLLDGLKVPQYCGGWQEVLSAFEQSIAQINITKFITYALQLGVAVSRRAGWVLDQLGVDFNQISSLAQIDRKGYRLLDPSRGEQGYFDPKWRLRLNHYGDIDVKK